jgi:hypothetical protein
MRYNNKKEKNLGERKMKKILLVAIFAAALLSLLVHQAFAYQINVFAPLNYAGVLPSNATAFASWGAISAPLTPSFASVNQLTGATVLAAQPTATTSGWAMSWFDSGWWQFNNVTQRGSVTADSWLYYVITGRAGIRAFLWVWDLRVNTAGVVTFWQVWTDTASDGLPGTREKSFDLNVNPYDLSNLGNNFQWTPGDFYYAKVLLFAYASSVPPGNSFKTIDGKFDDVLFITYTSSTGHDFLAPPLSPSISLSPPVGPVGTNVAVSGQGFAPNELVTLYWDSQPMNQTQTDANGSFFDIFVDVPSGSAMGSHLISAIGATNDRANSFFDIFTPASPLVGDINGDGKVSLQDLVLLANNYGRMDPSGAVQPATIGLSSVALAAAIPLALIEIRRKAQKKPKT